MFETDITSLDVDATLLFAAQAQALSERAEVRVLEAAAHYGDLHAVLDHPATRAGVSLPGTERLVELGGDGTPQVAEFAAAELGAVLAISPAAAAELIGAARWTCGTGCPGCGPGCWPVRSRPGSAARPPRRTAICASRSPP